jgi:hypothetical protein
VSLDFATCFARGELMNQDWAIDKIAAGGPL